MCASQAEWVYYAGLDCSLNDVLVASAASALAASAACWAAPPKFGKDAVDKNGRTPLYFAAFYGYANVTLTLLKKDAKVDESDNHRRTPLHVAAKNNHRTVLMALLKAGADVNAVDVDGRTPLHFAAGKGQDRSRVATALLEEGAGVDTVDQLRRTPLHFAANNGHANVIQAKPK